MAEKDRKLIPHRLCEKNLAPYYSQLVKEERWQELHESSIRALPAEAFQALGLVKVYQWGSENPRHYQLKPLPHDHACNEEEVRWYNSLEIEWHNLQLEIVSKLEEQSAIQKAAMDLKERGYARRKRQREDAKASLAKRHKGLASNQELLQGLAQLPAEQKQWALELLQQFIQDNKPAPASVNSTEEKPAPSICSAFKRK